MNKGLEYIGDYVRHLEEANIELQQRIDKAIEYIKKNTDENNYVCLLPSELQVLLKILGDKENE